ncbi:MAG: hypothetical protein QOF30_808, partial [Acidimicrobiaceae bacterium]|nr:hypothetical protein [Acidimicrobiaceae bacterium]
AGPRAALLKSASPDYAVRGLPAPLLPQTDVIDISSDKNDSDHELICDALGARRAILRLPPAADPLPVVVRGAALGPALVVTPSRSGDPPRTVADGNGAI